MSGRHPADPVLPDVSAVGPGGRGNAACAQKARVRAEMRRLLSQQGEDRRGAVGSQIAQVLALAPEWQQADTVLAFSGAHGEPNTTPLLELGLAEGRTVALPRVDAERLAFHVIGRLSQLERGYRKLLEPLARLPRLSNREIEGALILVPGVAFDRAGNRLGRGGGYYDRFLGRLRATGVTVVVAGVCSQQQLIDRVPHDPGDQSVDLVVTEQGWLAADGAQAYDVRHR